MTHGWVGATPYMDQRIDETATVIEILDEAGAVLVAERLSHGPVRPRRRIPANESTPGPAHGGDVRGDDEPRCADQSKF